MLQSECMCVRVRASLSGVTGEFLSGGNKVIWMDAINWVTIELNTVPLVEGGVVVVVGAGEGAGWWGVGGVGGVVKRKSNSSAVTKYTEWRNQLSLAHSAGMHEDTPPLCCKGLWGVGGSFQVGWCCTESELTLTSTALASVKLLYNIIKRKFLCSIYSNVFLFQRFL